MTFEEVFGNTSNDTNDKDHNWWKTRVKVAWKKGCKTKESKPCNKRECDDGHAEPPFWTFFFWFVIVTVDVVIRGIHSKASNEWHWKKGCEAVASLCTWETKDSVHDSNDG